MRKMLYVCIPALAICSSVGAQTHNQNRASQQQMIDAAEHPELIPDSEGYCLYFGALHLPENPSERDKIRQQVFLKQLNLTAEDSEKVPAIVADFDQAYRQLLTQYNEEAATAQRNHTKPNIQRFLVQRDLLIQWAQIRLSNSLSADGMARFHQHALEAKKQIKGWVRRAQ